MGESLEDDLIPGLTEGREEAFAALVDRMEAPLYRTAKALGSSAEEAEDLVQETFVALVRARSRLGEVRNLRGYVFATLRHAAAARGARRMVERRALSEVAGRRAGSAGAPAAGAVEADAERLEQAMASLPGEQREVIVLKIHGGLTFAEIGAALGISPNTAASRYQYALGKLRAALSEE